MTPVLRFAPSPNGALHLGHAYSALLNEALAARWGGRLLLRLEDIDEVRATPDRVAGVLDDLAWLGIRFDGPVRRQSAHFDAYGRAADRLRHAGLLYPCVCTRGEIAGTVADLERVRGRPWPRDPDGSPLYPGTCRPPEGRGVAERVAGGEPVAWRLDGTAALARAGPLGWTAVEPDGSKRRVAARPELWGDPILVRKEVPASYHLCVVHDDAEQGVTHVVRGAELEAATDLHVLLAHHLGVEPPRYHHHRLIRGPDGDKLAKSRGSDSLASLRGAGLQPSELRARLGFPI